LFYPRGSPEKLSNSEFTIAEGWACLVNHIEEVLRQLGDKRVINFVQLLTSEL
jgi:hypothetical protein